MRVHRMVPVLLAGLLLTGAAAFGQEPAVLSLDRPGQICDIGSAAWKFVPSDNLKFAEGIPSSEKSYTFMLTGTWQASSKETSQYFGTGWYELTFQVSPEVASSPLGMILPLSFGGVQVYLNGQLVCQTRPFGADGESSRTGTKPTLVTLPGPEVRTGVNRLDLRVASGSGWGGFSALTMKIGALDSLNSDFTRFLIRNTAIAFVCLFLFLYFLIHYLFRPKETYNLFFSLFCFFTGIFIVGYNGLGYFLVDAPWAYWLLAFLGGINMYLFPILFIHSFFQLRLKLAAGLFVALYLFLNAFVVVEYVFTQQLFFFNSTAYFLFNLSYILLAVYLLVISIQMVLKKLPYAGLMLAGVLFLVATFIQSMLAFTVIIKTEPLLGEGFFLMAVVFAVVLARRFARAHSSLEVTYAENLELNRTLEEKVKARTEELSEKNTQITSSIEYASLIQQAMLPEEPRLRAVFKDHFVVWKPRDIVGGDTYWFASRGKDFVFAVLDCTGHGVPGALLAMTASSTLDSLVHFDGPVDPREILGQLDRAMVRKLHQDHPSSVTDDGLEIAFCAYDSQRRLLTFSGSRLGLVVYRHGQVTEYKGDRRTIGYSRHHGAGTFTDQKILVSEDDRFYLCSDGFLDQHGGPRGFGFGRKRFLDTVAAHGNLELADQKAAFEGALTQWQGTEDQRDDITLVGFQVAFDE